MHGVYVGSQTSRRVDLDESVSGSIAVSSNERVARPIAPSGPDSASRLADGGLLRSLRRLVAIVLLASAGTWLFATRVFVDIDAVRIRVLRQPTPATDGRVELQAEDDRFSSLPAPLALIVRVRNLSPVARELTFYVDGKRVCAATIPPNAGRRIDCGIVRDWTVQVSHVVSVRGPPAPWTVEYLELATHHGHTTGFLQGFVLPAGSQSFSSARRHLAGHCLGRACAPASDPTATIRLARRATALRGSPCRRRGALRTHPARASSLALPRRPLTRGVCRDHSVDDTLANVAGIHAQRLVCRSSRLGRGHGAVSTSGGSSGLWRRWSPD